MSLLTLLVREEINIDAKMDGAGNIRSKLGSAPVKVKL